MLILPDQKINAYTIWDMEKHYNFLHSSLKKVIYQNPYRFYDGMIKSSTQLLLEEQVQGRKIAKLQGKCELVIITCTIKELILSRGKFLFDRKREIRKRLNWK